MTAAYQRHRRVALACLALASVSASAGCALLVSYDGFRGNGDGTPEAGASDGPTTDAGGDGAATGTADATDAADAPNACRGAIPGVYCGRNMGNYSGSVEDLVQCLGDGTTGSVTPCTATCATMPPGRQDVCNPCAGRADGPSCLQTIIVAYPDNDVRVVCSGGNVGEATLCPKGCASAACL